MLNLVPSARSRLRVRMRAFVDCEDGSATVWSLTWLLGFAIMAGVAIDSSNGWRNKTMLQSTTDAAALAGAMSLPNLELEAGYVEGAYGDVLEAAELYAGKNMARTAEEAGTNGGPVFGEYTDRDREDILIGHWDHDVVPPEFLRGQAPVNAVRVFGSLVEGEARNNGIGTALLHIVGLANWDVRAVSTAIAGHDPCLDGGIVARGELKMEATRSTIEGDVCVHGQLSVDVAGDDVDWANYRSLSVGANRPDVNASDPDGNWKITGHHYDLDSGQEITAQLKSEQNDHWDTYPALVDQIVEIGWSMLAGIPGYRNFLHDRPDDLTSLDPQPLVTRLPPGFDYVDNPPRPLDDSASLWRSSDMIRVASLDGFSGLGALLGMAQTASGTAAEMKLSYHATRQYPPAAASNYSFPVKNSDIDIDTAQTVTYETIQDGIATEVTDTVTVQSQPAAKAGIVAVNDTGNLKAAIPENQIYYSDFCRAGVMEIHGHVKNVTLVTNCRVVIAGDALIENAVILSTDTGRNNHQESVRIENGARIGSACDDWGNVRIYGNGNIFVSGGDSSATPNTIFRGTQLVAQGNIDFTAQSDMSDGISMMAGGDIHIRPRAQIGAISSSPAPSGCPVTAGLQLNEYDRFVQEVRLVE